MSEHHCWYVTGRTVRLAVALVLFVSLYVANPAFAAEDTVLAEQKAAIFDSHVTASASVGAEPLSIDRSVASYFATVRNFDPNAAYQIAALEVFAPATENKVDGGFVLANTSQDYESILNLAKKVASKLQSSSPPGPLPPSGYSLNGAIVLPKTGETNQAVLELARKGNTIIPTLIAWERDFEYFVPVATLASTLKFPSTFDPATRKIEGEFLSPENRYSIDPASGTYMVLGKTYPLPKEAILNSKDIKASDDLYVTVDLLNKIWPLDLSVDVYNQAISINAPRKLPFEREIERKKQQEKLEREKQEKERQERIEKNYVYTPNGYRLLGPQTLFLTETLGRSINQKGLNNNFFVAGQGDLLGTSSSYSLNITNDVDDPLNFEDFTIRLRREDYDSGGKLLPYGLDQIDLGDISVRSPSLVAGSLQGTGVSVSTDRNRQNIDFDEVTVEGSAQPGWDVEVYNRGVLIDSGVVDNLGRYYFENIPLTFGNNTIRLVFYGPQGEIEERTENYSIARSFLKPGETTFQASVVDRDTRVIELRETDENNKGLASTFRVNRGINRYMSGYATFSNLDLKDRTEKYISAGANFNALNGYGQVEVYKQLDKGEALDFRYARTFKGFDTNLRSSIFKDFESQKTGVGDHRKTTDTSLAINKVLSPDFASVNLGLALNRITYDGADTEIRLATAQAVAAAAGNLSHTTDTNFIGGELDVSSGQLAVNRPLSDGLDLNSNLHYETFPRTEFSSLDTTLSYTASDRFRASIGYGQNLVDTSSRSIDLGAGYDFDSFTGNANLGWATDDGINFTVGASTTLGPEGEDNVYNFRRQLDGQLTRLSVRLYEDLNHDSKFGPEDRPVPNARVLLNGGKKSSTTNEDGYVEVAPSGNEGLTKITLDRPSLSYNPFLISAEKDGHITILRAGTKPHIDFPLIMSGTIDGTVRDQDGRGMAEITVQLINAQGGLAGETTTLANGFYVFELVRPGHYVVQIHPSHRVFVPPKTVMVASDDLFVYAADLQVLSNQNLEQASEAAVAHDVEESRVAHTYLPRAAAGTEKPVAMPSGGGVQPTAGKVSESGVQPAIRAVRIGEYPDKVRLVLDLSGPAVYRISKEDNGSAITIDLPDTKWEADYNFAPDRQGLFQNFEINQLPNGGTQIKLTGKGKIDVSHDLLLPAAAGKNDRLYIDFTRAKK